MRPSSRRRLVAVLMLAGLGAVLWSLRARMLRRSAAEFERRYSASS